ncbi:MAG: glycosyltransferase family 4 protein [Nitrospirae bacterium]|nr:glycosyltransferase family 4 protein [Nitrospirota bacterium]
MKIALISAEYPPETDFGGLGSYVYKLAHALSVLGHRVTVVSSTSHGKTIGPHADGPVTVYRVPRPRYDLAGLGRSVNNIFYSIRVNRLLGRLIHEQGIEVIQFPDYRGEGLAYSFLGRTPYVVRFSMPRWLVDELNCGPACRNGPRMRINRAIDWWVENTPVRRCRAFIFPSRDIMNLMGRRVGVHGLCRVIYPGVNADQFKPGADLELRREYGVEGSSTVLYVGRLEFRKGVHILAEAAVGVVRRFPNTRFVFAGADSESAPGGGSMQAYMEQIADRNGIRESFRFIGNIKHHDVARIYGLGDVLVVPSLYENLANVLLEGMAAGLPIVTTSGGGSPEVVIHGTNGLVVPPGDPQSLADALSDLLADPRLRERYGHANRKKALEELSLERMARESVEVYAELLGGTHVQRV